MSETVSDHLTILSPLGRKWKRSKEVEKTEEPRKVCSTDVRLLSVKAGLKRPDEKELTSRPVGRFSNGLVTLDYCLNSR